jgi:transposase
MSNERGCSFLVAKYTLEYKLEVVKSVLEDGMTEGSAARKYNVAKSDVQKWTAAYRIHGISGITKKRISYTGEFKQKVVQDMRVNKLSFRETAAKYNLGNHCIAAKWERIYLEEGPEGLYKGRRSRTDSAPGKPKGRPPKLDKKVEEDLIAENQRLRMENAYLKKLNALVQEREKSEKKTKLK